MIVYFAFVRASEFLQKVFGQFKFFKPVCTCRGERRKTLTTAKFAIVFLIAPLASRANSISKPPHTIAVCVDDERPGTNNWTLSEALTIASGIFKKIGIRVDWRHSAGVCPAEGIRVTITYKTPPTLLAGTLAYANPGDHTVRLFYDRFFVRDSDSGIPSLLGHVFVHEIAHILQGVPRHSSSGIMKAHWTSDELLQMRVVPLQFADEDIELIDRGFRGHPAGSLSSQSSAILDAPIAAR